MSPRGRFYMLGYIISNSVHRKTQPIALVFEQTSAGSAPTLKLRIQSYASTEHSYFRIAFPNSSQDNPVIFMRDAHGKPTTPGLWEPTLDFIDVHSLSTQNASDSGSVKISMQGAHNVTLGMVHAFACRSTVCSMLLRTTYEWTLNKMIMVRLNLNANMIGISSVGTQTAIVSLNA